MTELRRGYLYGVAASVLWGVFPLYFRLLQPSSPLEILAYRVVFSVVVVGLLLSAMRDWGFLGPLLRSRRLLGGVTLAAVFIGLNWATYIYGVNSSRVVETALGYFITPLVVVLFGVTMFGERLRPAQWVAVGPGGLAVTVLTVDYGRLPYIALILAGSFGCYSLIKKRLALPPAEGLFVESAVLAVPALAYLAWLNAAGEARFGQVSLLHTVLMVLSGFATAVPLLLFAGAANRVPLTGVGILQYVAPILQLGCGVLIFHEPMPPARLAGFALVWAALAIFTVDGVRDARSSRSAEPVGTDPAATGSAATDPAAVLPPR